ncbi:MAG: hypothetical protein ACYS6K_13625 [Planctomycetota bacterium]
MININLLIYKKADCLRSALFKVNFDSYLRNGDQQEDNHSRQVTGGGPPP